MLNQTKLVMDEIYCGPYNNNAWRPIWCSAGRASPGDGKFGQGRARAPWLLVRALVAAGRPHSGACAPSRRPGGGGHPGCGGRAGSRRPRAFASPARPCGGACRSRRGRRRTAGGGGTLQGARWEGCSGQGADPIGIRVMFAFAFHPGVEGSFPLMGPTCKGSNSVKL